MKILRLLATFFLLCLFFGCKALDRLNKDKVVLAYVTSWSKDIPDPKYFTHLSYAFADIDSTFTNLSIENPERFKQIAELRRNNPNFKFLLSIGGWGSGNFSEMASSPQTRSQFIDNCFAIMKGYGLDGFDIDWEFPGSSLAGISSSPNDKYNFIKLIKEFRAKIGKDKVLSIASPSYGNRYLFYEFINYLDFVNVMTYDIATPPYHHAPMYKSDKVKNLTVPDVIDKHRHFGIPDSKILMGIPLYGRGDIDHYPKFKDYAWIKPLQGCTLQFDSVASAPYIADSKGNLIMTFDDTTSVALKCDYILNENLGGAMYWHYSGDGKDCPLKEVISSKLLDNK